jgi:hypothetical chaperone protein
MNYCGLDFGTSNSTLGVFDGNKPKLIPLEEGGGSAIRSAIFLNYHQKVMKFGKVAVNEYLSHEEGRLLMSIKSVLGSSLMEEKTNVFGEMMPFSEILGCFIKHIKDKGEKYIGKEIDSVVIGRPVHFDDGNSDNDKKAECTLEQIAKSQGFKNVLFQYEPIAAANTYRHSNPIGSLALIVDIGGGTSDFTILKIGKNSNTSSEDILASAGIHIGGTDIDRLVSLRKVMPLLGMGGEMRSSTGQIISLPVSIYHDLSTWHKINQLYSYQAVQRVRDTMRFSVETEKTSRLLTVLSNREGHEILESCEQHKIKLSDYSDVIMNLDFIEKQLSTSISQLELAEIINAEVKKIIGTILDMINSCSIDKNKIDVVFFTGGTSKLQYIREKILELLPNAKPIDGDVFGSVGLGLTYEAHDKFHS